MVRSRSRLRFGLAAALAAALTGRALDASGVGVDSPGEFASAAPAGELLATYSLAEGGLPADGIGCDRAVDCGVACGDAAFCAPADRGNVIYAAFEATVVQPRFGNNTAFTVMRSDGGNSASLSDAEFDYDLAFAPRVIAGLESAEGIGLRASWWQYDHDAARATIQPPANGFGAILHPPFDDITNSTTVPGSTFVAATGLNAYAIDLEMTKLARFSAWELGVACGVRYASVDQFYLAETTNVSNVLEGRINFQHETEGVGPTLALSGATPLTERVSVFGRGRGALLFGDATSHLIAGENLDSEPFTTPFTTTRDSTRDGLSPIGELQLGLRWDGQRRDGSAWRPYAALAMESQFWSGAGNAASEDDDLGFFGLAASGGVAW